VTNSMSHNVTKLSRNGASQETFAVGNTPLGLAFDGEAIWVANSQSYNMTKLSLNGATLGTFPLNPDPSAVAFDGTKIWVTYNYGVSRR